MFTSTLTHNQLIKSGLIINGNFRGSIASKELITLSKRAESYVKSIMGEDHSLSPLYLFADSKHNGEILTKIWRELVINTEFDSTENVEKISSSKAYKISVPAYFITEVVIKKKGYVTKVNNFIKRFYTAISVYESAQKTFEEREGVRLDCYPPIQRQSSRELYELVDAYITKLVSLIEEKTFENKLKEFNFVDSILIDGKYLSSTAEGKLYFVDKKEKTIEKA